MTNITEKLLQSNSMSDLLCVFNEYGPKHFSNVLKTKSSNQYKHVMMIFEKYYGSIPDKLSYSKLFYDYSKALKDGFYPKCIVCRTRVKFVSYTHGYARVCSKQCSYIDPTSKRRDRRVIDDITTKRNTTMKKLRSNTQWDEQYRKKLSVSNKRVYSGDKGQIKRKKQSDTIKAKILSGEFTPNVRNSYTRKVFEYAGMKFRSSFEVVFYAYHYTYKNNTNIEYEKLRIPYIGSDLSEHTYIVDFVDFQNKVVYEVKPYSMKNKGNNYLKELALIEWCNTNNFEYYCISETQLKEYSEELISNSELPDETVMSILRKYKWVQ